MEVSHEGIVCSFRSTLSDSFSELQRCGLRKVVKHPTKASIFNVTLVAGRGVVLYALMRNPHHYFAVYIQLLVIVTFITEETPLTPCWT